MLIPHPHRSHDDDLGPDLAEVMRHTLTVPRLPRVGRVGGAQTLRLTVGGANNSGHTGTAPGQPWTLTFTAQRPPPSPF